MDEDILPVPTDPLTAQTWKRFLRAPDSELVRDLYEPALSRAIHYDRCCAYFSSHVLSVAARGFGPFITRLLAMGDNAPRPAARLIVNEQLDPADLKALQATGDASQLAERLLRQLKNPTDALQKSRLEMLAWLVQQGFLEVRVGLMRHTRGIVHAKFGIVQDWEGNRLAFMGSDNETGNALTENFEMLTVSKSWDDPEAVDYYQDQFDRLWQDKDPQVTMLAVPDAVRLKLISFAPKHTPSSNQSTPNTAIAKAVMQWQFFAAAPYLEGGEYTSDATAFVDLWPHQRRVIEDTARNFPAGRLLCDEVGMGKTVEAILVLRRLLAGRGVKRALILVPAGLLKQWQDELREKGGLVVPRWESGFLHFPDGTKKQTEVADALAKNDLLLMSREWARLEQNLPILMTAPQWDLVLLDEAHAARRSSPDEGAFNQANLLLALLRNLQLRRRTRGILLLSATPMQTQPWEPWDLLQPLGVGDDWLVDFGDIRAYYDTSALLMKGESASAQLRTVARLVENDTEFPKPPTNLAVSGGLERAITFAGSSKRPGYAEWLRRGAPLGRRMHRNTRDTLREYHKRGLLDTEPPRRNVEDEVFDYATKEERAVYDAIAGYINERFSQLETQKPGKGFVMTVYRRRASSCSYALRKSLERRLDGLERVVRKQHSGDFLTAADFDLDLDLGDEERDRIDPALPSNPKEAQAEADRVRVLLDKLKALGSTDSKLARFFEILKEITSDGRSGLIFTEYADTLEYLRDQLLPTYGITLGCYSGAGGQVWDETSWKIVPKTEITQRLRDGRLKILVCTDAASEGLNLQAASALINFDLPFNPSKVEQRIGRIDRIGQKQALLPIRNLFLKDSVDMRVYSALRKRCGLFEHFVGPMQPVLAFARDVLQGTIASVDIEKTLTQLEARATEVEKDTVGESAFLPSTVTDEPPIPKPAVHRDELTALLDELAIINGGPLSITRADKQQLKWRISGLSYKSILITTSREILESDDTVQPLTGIGSLAGEIARKLPPMGTRAPLVIAERQSGPFHAAEVRWIGGSQNEPVQSLAQLRKLLQGWDGSPPSPARILEAETEAGIKAQARLQALEQAAVTAAEAGLQRQVQSARKRLMKELSRTLRCFGDGDLNELFKTQINRDRSKEQRYVRAFELLGGFPEWPSEIVFDANEFAKTLTESKRTGRILGSEIDAALDDPRWKLIP